MRRSYSCDPGSNDPITDPESGSRIEKMTEFVSIGTSFGIVDHEFSAWRKSNLQWGMVFVTCDLSYAHYYLRLETTACVYDQFLYVMESLDLFKNCCLGDCWDCNCCQLAMSKNGGIDLDSILDQALDDFEEIELAQSAKKVVNIGARQSTKDGDQMVTEKAIQSGGANDRLAQVILFLLDGVIPSSWVLPSQIWSLPPE